MTGKLHDADLLWIEGDGYNVYCGYKDVEAKRFDIVKRMLYSWEPIVPGCVATVRGKIREQLTGNTVCNLSAHMRMYACIFVETETTVIGVVKYAT